MDINVNMRIERWAMVRICATNCSHSALSHNYQLNVAAVNVEMPQSLSCALSWDCARNGRQAWMWETEAQSSWHKTEGGFSANAKEKLVGSPTHIHRIWLSDMRIPRSHGDRVGKGEWTACNQCTLVCWVETVVGSGKCLFYASFYLQTLNNNSHMLFLLWSN